MASLLMQERLLGFSLGVASGLSLAAYQYRLYWRSTADLSRIVSRGQLPQPTPIQVPEPLFNKAVREKLAHRWNQSVDNTLGALIAALSSRGW